MSSAARGQSAGQGWLVLLASKLGYQTRTFVLAAQKLDVPVLLATDRCVQLDDPWGDQAIPVRFEHPAEAAEAILARAAGPIHAVLALGDHQVPTAAWLAEKLGLPGLSFRAAEQVSSKARQREALAAAGLPVPKFQVYPLDAAPAEVLRCVGLPCVVKPIALAASQGVIRADTPADLAEAIARVSALLRSPEFGPARQRTEFQHLLVEQYVGGREVALEALLTHGHLRPLALFDKPDPLEGPYFEETMYITPSRLPVSWQAQVIECARNAAQALGLAHGPLHAEFRVEDGHVWVLELHARPIGGLCARALRFGPELIGLEELLIRHALGWPGADWEREPQASGVMMIPVPGTGLLVAVDGIEQARSVEGITGLEITARLYDPVRAWPEGTSYLGFIFARAERPEQAESALRQAHGQLRVQIVPELPVEHPARSP
jgi:biotin carboxylase